MISETSQPITRLPHFPVSFFSVILGLGGLTIALQRAHTYLGLNPVFSTIGLVITVVLMAVLTLAYLAKILIHPKEVQKELHHPIKLHFFPTIFISVLIISVALLHSAPDIARNLWIIGTIGQLTILLRTISVWIQHTHFEMKHMNPSWFIPAVGTLFVPIAGVDFAPLDLSWFFFSVGILFWFILLVLFFNRIIFHHPLPEKLLPTKFILIAPPAIAYVALGRLLGEPSIPGSMLYFVALFFFLLLIVQYRLFSAIKFYLSWWAYTFPISALTIATILRYRDNGDSYLFYLSGALLIFLVALVLVLSVRTIKAIGAREVCVEEE